MGDHPGDDTLELYVLSRLSENEMAMLERHVLECPECAHRLDEARTFVRAIQEALRQLREQEED